MAANPGNRDARKEALALALARGHSVKAAAQEAGVSERTAHTYRKEPGFDERVRRCRGELFSQAVSVLAGTAALAAGTLAGLLRSQDEKILLGAGRALLEQARAWREGLDLAEGLASLRAEWEAWKHGHGGAPQGAGAAAAGDNGRAAGGSPVADDGALAG